MSSKKAPPTLPTPTEATADHLKQLDACIHCGFCLPVCPTYEVTGSEAESPRGRLYLMRHVLDESQAHTDSALTLDDIKPHMESCLGCLACETACPSGVQYDTLLTSTREQINHNTHLQPSTGLSKRRIKRWALAHVLPSNMILGGLTTLLTLYQESGLQWLVRQSKILSALPLLNTPEQLLPRIRYWQGRQQGRKQEKKQGRKQEKRPPLKAGMTFGNPSHPTVALFTGCIMNHWFQRIHWATITVLVAQGYCVHIPEQTCCGALATHSGEHDIAQPLAEKNIQTLLRTNYQHIVINSAGCGSALKAYPAEYNFNQQQADQWQHQVVDILELLSEHPLSTTQLASPFSSTQHIAYQAACHLRHAQQVSGIEDTLLSQLPDVQVIAFNNSETCCGSAGTYNIEHPKMAQSILKNKLAGLWPDKPTLKTGSLTDTPNPAIDWMLSANPGCLMQYEMGLRQQGNTMTTLAHPIELIAMYYPSVT